MMQLLRKMIFTLTALLFFINGQAQDNVMKVHVINVGQGLSVLVEFPCGVILVDSGGEFNKEFHSTDSLSKYLDAFFKGRPELHNTIDLFVLSHPHIDHTRAAMVVANKYKIKNVITNGQNDGSGGKQQAALHKKISDAEGTTVVTDDIGYFESIIEKIPAAGMTNTVISPLKCGDASPVVKVLWGGVPSSHGWSKVDFDNKNNHSVVLRIDYGKSSILLPGDLEETAIGELLTKYKATGLLDADVYVTGHHGSKNGSTSD